MYRCVQKDKSTLNPIKFIEFVEEAISREPSMLDEVALRRFISALYFSLFNYLAERSYIKGRRGKGGPCQDSFSYSEFHTYLSQRQLGFVAHLLLYRVTADHYTLNPTYVRVSPRLNRLGVPGLCLGFHHIIAQAIRAPLNPKAPHLH